MSIEIIHQLRLSKGSTAKLKILKSHTENQEWKDYLYAVYDSSINYYVSAPVDNTFVDECDIPTMLVESWTLSNRRVTGNRARAHSLNCSRKYGELWRLMLKGSINANVSTTTINKAYPGLIPVFKVMLAQSEKVTEYPVWTSIKYDGVRVVAFVHEDKTVQLKTRSGKLLYIDSLGEELESYPVGVYDGELVSGNGKQAGRSAITGSVNKVLKGSATDIDDYAFCVFDMITHKEWEDQKGYSPYSTRYLTLSRVLKPSRRMVLAEQISFDNELGVDRYYAQVMAQGFEGLICRYPQDVYEWRRSAKLIKKKATISCVLICTGIEEGSGKYVGMIGSLVCSGTVEGKYVQVRVGSGLSDYERENSDDCYIGHHIEVLYNDIVQAKGATDYSLFLPRFKRVKGELDT